MQAYIKSFILIIVVGFASVGFTRGAGTPPGKGSAVKAAVLSFPYDAQITEDNAPVRSGSGTNYYICGKLKKGDKVKVVSSQFSWSRIVPPAGSFSWIHIRNVSIDPDDSTTGIVTAEGIRVYAGSEHKEPLHSEHLQLKLNRGDEVKFVGKQKGDYYKIAPPGGAYLWVSTKYTKALAAPPPKVIPTIVIPTTTDANTKPKPKPKPEIKPFVPKTVAGESENLKLYYTLQKLIKAEQAKPTDQRDYTNIKKTLVSIAGNKEAGKAARYAGLAIKQIKGFELAMVIAKEVQLQNQELQKTQEQIDKARTTRLGQVEALGVFAVIGKFHTSSLFTSGAEQKHYRITDDKNKTVCYAVPIGSALKRDLSKLAGSKVGLIGTIAPYPQTSGALVRFTNIVELN
ncbi:MAG: SH3 domain-containing protein [Planctomycetota bacterium]|jgi:hypothetical protein